MVTTAKAVANIWDQFQNFDRNTLTPYAVGFDRVFDRLNDYAMHQATSSGFPPYNIRKGDDNTFTIELALAGLTRDDLEIEVAEGVLTVRTTDKKEEAADTELLHRGISFRKFSRKWTLADDIVVKDAKMENGMLLIHLERIIPEEKKPRLIEIK
jgi:molecular chaperone IbpA